MSNLGAKGGAPDSLYYECLLEYRFDGILLQELAVD